MKICPTCKHTYENTTMRFCGNDGGVLEVVGGTVSEVHPAPPKNYLQFTSAPVSFSYVYHGGLPHGNNYQTFGYAGQREADEVWRVSFRDDSKQNQRAPWEVKPGNGFAGKLQDTLQKIEIAESLLLGGGYQFSVRFADGTDAFGCLEKESEVIWQSFLSEIQKQYAPETIPPPPSSGSLLMALFANHFAPAASMLSGTTNVPCQPNVKVNSTELGLNLIVGAFYYLREENLISLNLGAKKGWIFKQTPVFVAWGGKRQQYQIPGIEDDFLQTLRLSPTGVTAEQIVFHFLGATVEYPQTRTFERITQIMVKYYYGQYPTESKQAFFRNAKSIDFNFVPDCARIAALSPQAQAFHTRWQQFQTQEKELCNALMAEIKRAVSSRTYRERSDDESDYDSSFD